MIKFIFRLFKRKTTIEKIRKNWLYIFNLRAGVDCCPVCDSELFYEVKERWFSRGSDFSEETTYCAKGCFALLDDNEISTHPYKIFLFKKYFGGYDRKSINMLYKLYKKRLLTLEHSNSNKFSTFMKCIEEIEYYRKNERYVIEWLENNVYSEGKMWRK